jgi:uncharacterized protein Usg
MPDELITKLKTLVEALNAANDGFRAALAELGISTAEDYFRLTENKALLQRFLTAQAYDVRKFAALALAHCETLQ